MSAKPATRPRLGRGVLFNLAGLGTSLLLAVFAIPLLAQALGLERFGVLALAWSVLGFAALLNLGIGRALTQAVARRSAAQQEVVPLVWTALLLLGLFGMAGGAALALTAPRLASLLRLGPSLTAEAGLALRLLAVAVPFAVTGSGLISLLEARQQWGRLQLVAVPLAALTYLGPLLALQFSDGLVPVIGTLVGARILAWCAHLVFVLRTDPSLPGRPALSRTLLRPLLAFGGWTTVSQVASPLMLYADRFVIAGALSASAVAYYATPQEIVLRLGPISGAVILVLFPAFAAASNHARSVALLERGTRAVFTLVFPMAFVLTALSTELLAGWMGESYAREGATVLRWLALGLLINAFAKVPSTYLQGVGRPDVTARLHLIELPLYAGALWLLVAQYGLRGAAAAWTLRMAADAVALFWLCARLLPGAGAVVRRAAVMAGGGSAAVAAAAALPNTHTRLAAVLLCIPLFVLIAWSRLLDDSGRSAMRSAFGRPSPSS